MEYYNLQEAVSEECYDDIINKVAEILESESISEEHLREFTERMINKHGPEIVGSAVHGIKNVAHNVGNKVADKLVSSNSGVSKFVKGIPGVKQSLRKHILTKYSNARAQNLNSLRTAEKTIDTNYAKDSKLAKRLPDRTLRSGAMCMANARATDATNRINQNYKTRAQELRNKVKGQLNSLK